MADEREQELTHPIILEIMPEDPRDVDPVAIGEVGRGILDEVKRDGMRVEPVYTGVRGGHELLFEILNSAQAVGQVVWADINAQGNTIGIVSGLVTILQAASSVVKSAFHARERHEEKQAKIAGGMATKGEEQHPIKILLTVDGATIPVEVSNFEDAKAMLQLAREFHAKYPNVHATEQSEVKVRAVVPKKAQRGRR